MSAAALPANLLAVGVIVASGLAHGAAAGRTGKAAHRIATVAIAALAVTQIGFGIHDREQLARLEAAVHLHSIEE